MPHNTAKPTGVIAELLQLLHAQADLLGCSIQPLPSGKHLRIFARFRLRDDVNICSRRVPKATISKVTTIIFLSLFVIVLFTFIILGIELPQISHHDTRDSFIAYLFEVVSAYATVGLSMGVTNNLQRRVLEHREGKGSTFTKRYNLIKLVYFECGSDIRVAIFREKQIKAGPRRKKLDLVNKMNPEWKDLFDEFFS